MLTAIWKDDFQFKFIFVLFAHLPADEHKSKSLLIVNEVFLRKLRHTILGEYKIEDEMTENLAENEILELQELTIANKNDEREMN